MRRPFRTPPPYRVTSVERLWRQLRIGGWPLFLIEAIVAGVFVFVLFEGRNREIEAFLQRQVGPLDVVPDSHISGYDAAWLRQYANRLTPEGREIYCRTQLLYDFAFPVVYAAVFASVLAIAYRGTGPAYPHFRFVLVAPAAAVVCDWAENLLLLGLIRGFPGDFPPERVWLASSFTQLKWAAAFTAGAFALVGIVASVRYTWMVNRRRPSR